MSRQAAGSARQPSTRTTGRTIVAVKKIENSHFLMLLYDRENEKDYLQFKMDCDAIVETRILSKDIVLDFTGCGATLPNEMTLIGSVLRKAISSSRLLKLIANPGLSKKLSILRLDRTPGLRVYPARSAFLSECIGTANTSAIRAA